MHYIESTPPVYTASGYKIQPRKPALPGFDDVSRLWTSDSIWFCQFFNALSIIIPEAERFMMRAVRMTVKDISNSQLQKECKAFLHQEANHFKAHNQFNQRLEEQGFRAHVYGRATEKLFKMLERLPYSYQLGVSSFLEHFTATISNMGLEDMEDYHSLSEPLMLEFWLWHGVEELEHKEVVFDLFQEMSGSFVLRILTALMSAIFLGAFLAWMTFMLITEYMRLEKVSLRSLFSKERRVKSEKRRRFGKLAEKFPRRFIVLMAKYFHPSFHPSDLEDSGLLEKWYSRVQSVGKGERAEVKH